MSGMHNDYSAHREQMRDSQALADPVAASKTWRDKHEKDYAELVIFVKALSAAPVYQGLYLLAYWRKDAQTLLKLLNGER